MMELSEFAAEPQNADFMVFVHSMKALLGKLGYELDPLVSLVALESGQNYGQVTFENKAKSRSIRLQCFQPSGSLNIVIASETGNFRFHDYLLREFRLSVGTRNKFWTLKEYYDAYLKAFEEQLKDPRFADILNGLSWREWQDLGWEPYK